MKLLAEEKLGISRTDVIKKWVFRIPAALIFIAIGYSKFGDTSSWVKLFATIGLGQWLRILCGVMQVGGGLMILIPRTFVFGIFSCAATLLGAMLAWIFVLGNPMAAMIPAILMFALLFIGGEEIIEFFNL
jgi:putative oxidoreductase